MALAAVDAMQQVQQEVQEQEKAQQLQQAILEVEQVISELLEEHAKVTDGMDPAEQEMVRPPPTDEVEWQRLRQLDSVPHENLFARMQRERMMAMIQTRRQSWPQTGSQPASQIGLEAVEAPAPAPGASLCISCYTNPRPEQPTCTCANQMCLECLARFTDTRIRGHYFNGRCATCAAPYDDDFLKSMLSSETFTILERQRAAADPNAFICANTACEAVLRRTRWASRITCEACNTTTCAHCCRSHSALYPCRLAEIPQNLQFQAWKMGGGEVANGVKRCPKCLMYIEKNLGCRHMTCINCRHEFCWHCHKTHSRGHYPWCKVCEVLDSSIWGKSACTRVVTKSIGIPIGVPLVIGIGAAGVAVGIGLGAAAAALFIPGFMGYACYRGIKECRYRVVPPNYNLSGESSVGVVNAEVVIQGWNAAVTETITTKHPNGRWIADEYYVAYSAIRNHSALVYFRNEQVQRIGVERMHYELVLAGSEFVLESAPPIEQQLSDAGQIDAPFVA